jgi:hypothetical protein
MGSVQTPVLFVFFQSIFTVQLVEFEDTELKDMEAS